MLTVPGSAAAPWLAHSQKLVNADIDNWLSALVAEGRTLPDVPTLLGSGGVFNVRHFNCPTDGVTDATASFTSCDAAALAFGGSMFVPPLAAGYKVSGFNQTCKRVKGSGLLGKLTTTLNASIYSFGADDITCEDVAVQGNSVGGAQNGFSVSNRSKFRLLNPTALNCGGAGIYATQNLGTQFYGGRVINPECYGNLIGFQADVRAEYMQVIGGLMCENTTGVWDVGGNCTFIGMHVNHNTDGFRLETGVNDSHGCAIGCKINHNTQYEIRANGIVNGFVFSGCHIFEHDVWLKNCLGIHFTDCELSVTNWYFEGGVTLIESCVIDPSYGNIINNNFNATPSHVQWRNNRRLDGTCPSFLENINGLYASGLVVAGAILNAVTGRIVFGTLSFKSSNNGAQTKYAVYNAANDRFKNWGLGGNKVRVQLLIKLTYTAVSTVPASLFADIGYYANDAGPRLIAAGYLPIQVYPGAAGAGTIFVRFDGFLDLDALSTFDFAINNTTNGTLTLVASESYVRIEGL